MIPGIGTGLCTGIWRISGKCDRFIEETQKNLRSSSTYSRVQDSWYIQRIHISGTSCPALCDYSSPCQDSHRNISKPGRLRQYFPTSLHLRIICCNNSIGRRIPTPLYGKSRCGRTVQCLRLQSECPGVQLPPPASPRKGSYAGIQHIIENHGTARNEEHRQGFDVCLRSDRV